MTDIRLSATILALNRTPAEKILLAYLCQRAALADGYCTDSNRELALGTAIHLQTVSDLINRLSQTSLLEASVDPALANQRTLRPSNDLVEDYKPIDYSHSTDYKSTDYSTDEDYKPNDYSARKQPNPLTRPVRLCAITGVDITHQRASCPLVTMTTVRALFRADRQRFDELMTRFLTPQQAQESMSGRCMLLAQTVRKVAKAQLPVRPTRARNGLLVGRPANPL